MRRTLNVSHDSLKAFPAKGIVRCLEPVDADKHGSGRGVNGKRAVCIDDDCEVPEPIGIVDNIVETILPIAPETRFATLEIETTAALPVERVDRRGDLLEAQVLLPASVDVAVSTTQVAAVGENQPADERPGLPEELIVDDVSQSVKQGLHGRTEQLPPRISGSIGIALRSHWHITRRRLP